MSTLLIVNPQATSADRWVRDVIVTALRSLGPLELGVTEYKGHAHDLARGARDRGVQRLVVFSGDGTLNEVANGLAADGHGGQPVIGALPGGHANVVARSLGLARDPVAATGMLLEAFTCGRTRELPLARADERWFLFSAGMGMDAAVLRLVDEHRAAGGRASVTRYAAAALLQYARQGLTAPPVMRVETDGRPALEGVRGAVVQCGPVWTYVGAVGLSLSPRSEYGNGFDTVSVTTGDPATFGRHLARVAVRPGAGPVAGVDVAPDSRRTTITSGLALPLQVDGEVLGDRTAVTITTTEFSLCVATPTADPA